jgi:hypothetical protein
MLSIASEKAALLGLDILWINQDMTDFELFGTVGAITCFLDGINHVIDKRALKRLFKLAYNYLDYGGIFVFDLLRWHHFSKIASEKVFCESDEKGACIWKAYFSSKLRICRYEITCFYEINGKAGSYGRADDTVRERFWEFDEIDQIARNAGFEFNDKLIYNKNIRSLILYKKER